MGGTAMNLISKVFLSVFLVAILAGVAVAGGIVSNQPLPINRDIYNSDSGSGLLDCSSAIEVELGVLYTMDNGDGNSNVGGYVDCWPWEMTGPELVFHVIFPDRWQITLTQMDADVDGIILTDCDEAACFYAWDYQYVWTNSDEPGEYWVVIDGWNGQSGEFAIIFEELGPQGPACDSLHQLFPYESGDIIPPGSYEISGNNCGASNTLYEFCGEFLGLDDWWEINLLPGGMVEADATILYGDCGLCLVEVCDNPTESNCLAWVNDNGDGIAEMLSYTNTTQEVKTIFLVVDNVTDEMDACDGLYSGNIHLEGEAVPANSVSWGKVKTLFT